MRKSKDRGSLTSHKRAGQGVSLTEPDTRAGRVGGAQVAFGAPGPKIDLNAVLDSWRDGASVGGAERGRKAPDRADTVSLSDGTTISFSVARPTIPVE